MREESEEFKKTHKMPGTAGYFINRFVWRSPVDYETGEIWGPVSELEGIRKALNCRQCWISRMPAEDTGAFWNATVYSPRDAKMGSKLELSLKSGLDPKKYGGYSSQQFAYFFIYEAEARGKNTYRFAEVPVWLSHRMRSMPDALESYARSLASNEGIAFVRIVRRRLLKNQLIEIDGERFVITGKKRMRNAREIALRLEEALPLANYINRKKGQREWRDDLLDAASATELLKRVIDTGRRDSPRLFKQIKSEQLEAVVAELTDDAKLEIANRLLILASGADNKADLRIVRGGTSGRLMLATDIGKGEKFTPVQGVREAGDLQPPYEKFLNDPEVEFVVIDQSVTGMFERRARIGL